MMSRVLELRGLMRSLFLNLIFLLGLNAASAHAGTIDIIAGGLPKDTGIGEFTLTIAVRNITPLQIQKGTDRNDIAKTFEIRLKDIDSNPIAFSAAEAALTPVKFYAEKVSDAQESASADDALGQNRDLTYQIKIREIVAGELTAKIDKLKIISLTFKLGGEIVVAATDRTLTRENYAINAAVLFTNVLGSHKSLVASWTSEASVATISNDNLNRAPGAVTVYAVAASVADGTLFPAKVFANDLDTPDTDTNCIYRTFAKEAIKSPTGCLECPDNSYLNESAIAAIDGVKIATAPASAGSATISGLVNASAENPTHYYVFMEYKPGGLKRSQCAIGVASPNFTMTELNGEKDAQVVDFRCFIATAAYGSPLHEDLLVFRNFRDRALLSSGLGRSVVALYYFVSPSLAAFIAQHDDLKSLVRGTLSLLADNLRQRGYGAPSAANAGH